MPTELIKESVSRIMTAMKEGKFSLKELEFLEKFFMEGSVTTTKLIKKIKLRERR